MHGLEWVMNGAGGGSAGGSLACPGLIGTSIRWALSPGISHCCGSIMRGEGLALMPSRYTTGLNPQATFAYLQAH
jgi:hypothetical protein